MELRDRLGLLFPGPLLSPEFAGEVEIPLAANPLGGQGLLVEGIMDLFLLLAGRVHPEKRLERALVLETFHPLSTRMARYPQDCQREEPDRSLVAVGSREHEGRTGGPGRATDWRGPNQATPDLNPRA